MPNSKPVFDFHFHPLFKAFIKKYEAHYPSVRAYEDLIETFNIEHALWDKIDELFLHFLDSQCAVEQISDGNVTHGFVAIAPIEKMFASKKGLGGKLLNDKVVTNPMDPQYLNMIREGDISYYHLFIKELQLYQLLESAQESNFSMISRAKSKPPTKFQFALGMEGGHALIRTRIDKPGEEDATHAVDPAGGHAVYQDFIDHKILEPEQSLKHLQTALWKEGLDLHYLVLTHLSNIPGFNLATHAYGAKFLKTPLKLPIGFGISAAGRKVIKKAYTLRVSNKDASVMIDLKHMSLKSRQDLYALRRQHDNYAKIPIIASHMGVTGYSTSEWVNALDRAQKGNTSIPSVKVFTEPAIAGKWGGITRTYDFNPWTINLMDDDIIEVIRSKGLIGISLDVRILGFESRFKDLTGDMVAEYMSPEEFRHFFPHYNIKGMPLETYEEEALESKFFPNKKESHMLSFCYNILHIIHVGQAAFPQENDFWQYICIGSDFDGLIDPLKSCRDAGAFQGLRRELHKWLPIADKSYAEYHGTDRIVDRDHLSEYVDAIMYQSGRNFMKKRYKV